MKVGFLQNSYAGGGAEKVALTLSNHLSMRGHQAVLLANRAVGPLLSELPAAVPTVELRARGPQLSRLTPLRADPGGVFALVLPVILAKPAMTSVRFVHGLKDYLQNETLDLLVSMTPTITLQAIWARRLARVKTRLMHVQSSYPSGWLPERKTRRYRHLVPLLRRSYREVDVFVAVSNGVADDLVDSMGLPRSMISTIYNPVLTPDLAAKAKEPLDHPWFREGQPPVVLSAGRLTDLKDHPTLIRAFAKMRANREARLVILGQAPNARETRARIHSLRELARSLGVERDLDLPGFESNPFNYMKQAGLFVLTSRAEGLGNVLIEALACGCPVVSTDCPTGPSEILKGGQHGKLVPVGDVDRLTAAMMATLDEEHDRVALRKRAEDFSAERVTAQYEQLLLSCLK